MTDGGALPIAISDLVWQLRERQSARRDDHMRPRVRRRLRSRLGPRRARGRAPCRGEADAVVVAMGPGGAGTANPARLQRHRGRPGPRRRDRTRRPTRSRRCARRSPIPRPRHRGVSHHSITAPDGRHPQRASASPFRGRRRRGAAHPRRPRDRGHRRPARARRRPADRRRRPVRRARSARRVDGPARGRRPGARSKPPPRRGPSPPMHAVQPRPTDARRAVAGRTRPEPPRAAARHPPCAHPRRDRSRRRRLSRRRSPRTGARSSATRRRCAAWACRSRPRTIGDGSELGYRVRPDDYYLPDLGLDAGGDRGAARRGERGVAREPRGGGRAAEAGRPRPTKRSRRSRRCRSRPRSRPSSKRSAPGRSCTFTHRDRLRTVEPWGLSSKRGHWYVVGFDRDRDAVRAFRADRIDGDVEIGEANAFEAPADFRPDDHVESRAWLLGDEPAGHRARSRRRRPLRRDARRARRRRHGRRERERQGSAVIELTVTNRAAFRTFVLGFLEHAEVLEPPELRADVVAWLERVGRGSRVSPRALAGPEIQRILALVPWIVAHPGSPKHEIATPLRHHRRPARRRPRARADDRRPAVFAGRLPRRRRGRRRPRHDPARRLLPAPAAAHARRRSRAARGRARACSRFPVPIRTGRSRPRSPSWRTRSSSRVSSSTSASRAISKPSGTRSPGTRARRDRLLVGRTRRAHDPPHRPRGRVLRDRRVVRRRVLPPRLTTSACSASTASARYGRRARRSSPARPASRPATSTRPEPTTRGSRSSSHPRPRGSPRPTRPSR